MQLELLELTGSSVIIIIYYYTAQIALKHAENIKHTAIKTQSLKHHIIMQIVRNH